MDFMLRPWVIDDLDSLVRYANNINIAKFMSDGFPFPYTSEKGKTFIEFATNSSNVLYFAIDINGQAVGGIGISPKTDVKKKNAELGYWLGEPFWGKGIITRAIGEIVDIAFKTYDITRIFAAPYGTNFASHRVLKKSGFKLEARFEKTIYKNGEFLDELIFAIHKTDINHED
jgi:[ribosomal protein S5]-alanine N-acetyltransferase